MFSKELEGLIQATLEDGILEENEKAALVKRAQAEGVDLAELEIYINSIMQRRQRELNEKKDAEYAKIEQQKKEAIGKVCPKCGRQVAPLTLVCECGFEFNSKKVVSSVQSFFDSINNIQLSEEEMKECMDDVYDEEKDQNGKIRQILRKDADGNVVKEMNSATKEHLIHQKKLEIIQSFPVPNSKEDIIEFLALSLSEANKKLNFFDYRKNYIMVVGGINALIYIICFFTDPFWIFAIFLFITIPSAVAYSFNNFEKEDSQKAWRAKFDQVLMKGRSLRGDAEFTRQLDYYENIVNQK